MATARGPRVPMSELQIESYSLPESELDFCRRLVRKTAGEAALLSNLTHRYTGSERLMSNADSILMTGLATTPLGYGSSGFQLLSYAHKPGQRASLVFAANRLLLPEELPEHPRESFLREFHRIGVVRANDLLADCGLPQRFGWPMEQNQEPVD